MSGVGEISCKSCSIASTRRPRRGGVRRSLTSERHRELLWARPPCRRSAERGAAPLGRGGVADAPAGDQLPEHLLGQPGLRLREHARDEGHAQAVGTHSTPRQVAEYVVNRLDLSRFDLDGLTVFEPFTGAGVFLVA